VPDREVWSEALTGQIFRQRGHAVVDLPRERLEESARRS
jgi:hypothetical protein